jgi:hypothetical protein
MKLQRLLSPPSAAAAVLLIDLLETRTQGKHLCIGGIPVNLETKQTRLIEKYSVRP